LESRRLNLSLAARLRGISTEPIFGHAPLRDTVIFNAIASERLDAYRAAHKAAVTTVLALRYPETHGTIDKMTADEYSICQQVLPYLPDSVKGGESAAQTDERSQGVAKYKEMVDAGKIKTNKLKE